MDKVAELPNRGKAICAWYKILRAGYTSSAVVKINGDGPVTLLTGASEIAQDSNTVPAQIVGAGEFITNLV